MKVFDEPEFKPSGLLIFGKNQKRALKSLAFDFFWQFAKEVEKQTKKKYFRAASDIDQMRLLTMRAWMLEYKVSLEFIVRSLVPYWQKKLQGKFKRGKFGIGVSISTLVGNISEQILRSAIQKEFPDEENIIAWKSQQKYNRLRRPVKRVAGEEFFETYARVMQIRQARNDRALNSNRFTKRPYRGNPFL